MFTQKEYRLPAFSDGVTLCLKELLHYKNQSVRWLPPAKSLWAQLNGVHQSVHKGRGMDFSEVRLYQAGDDIRSIDWRVTARTGKAHTKLYMEEKERSRMLFIDLSAGMYFGSQLLLKSVQAMHLASLLAWLAVNQEDRIGALILVGDKMIEVRAQARERGALALLNALLKGHAYLEQIMQSGPLLDGDYNKALRHLNRVCPKGSELIFISDFYSLLGTEAQLSAAHQVLIARLCSHNVLRFVSIYDPLEQGQTPYRGREYVTDHRRSAWIDFSRAENKHLLAQDFLRKQEAIQQITKRHQLPLYHISAAQPLINQLGVRESRI